MARLGRPTARIELTVTERDTLRRWARRHRSSQALALRCRIVLAAADDRSNADIAAELRVHPTTVSKWRHRFATDRLDGLTDAPRPGAARTIGDDVVEAIVVETLETAPPDATHWSARSLAAKHGISHQTVAEIWRAFGLKPWREDSFKISPGPGSGGEGPRHRGVVHEPAGASGRVRRRRETPDPSPQPDRADIADAAHHTGASHPRLSAQRHL
jgi:transposase